MATQGGSNNPETQAKIELLYVSEGYKKSVQELQSLLDLVDKLKGDLGKVTMPAIKGLKGALREAGELSQAIQALTHQGSVASVKPLSDKPTKKEQADYKKAMQVQAADTVVRQTQLDTQDKTLRLQRQLAAEKAKELERQAFSGQLTQDQIKAQAGNIDNLKAIARGLEQSAKAGKAHAPLQQQVTTLLTEEISRRKLKATTERQLETQARQEERKVALEYARKAARSGDTGALKDYLKNAELQQVKNLEYAMRGEVGRKGYTKTSSVMEFNALVAERRKELTKTSPIVESSSILESIKAAKHKGDANYILSQAQAELRRQVKEGASPESLRQLYRTLADAKSEAAKKFAPISPYQEAKTAEETYAKNLLKYRFNKKTVAEATRGQIEEDLKASKILSHKTLAPLGSLQHRKETAYQKFLTDTLKARALETPEAKEAAERKRSSQERTQRGKDELSRALEFINPNLASKEKLVEHIKGLQTVKNVNSEIQASQIRLKKGNISVLSTEWEKEKAYQKALKARLAIIKDVSKVILDRDAKHIRDTTLLATIANRRTAAEKAQARAEYDAEKRRALQTGKLLDPNHIKELKTDFEKKLAKDALNFGISTGFFNHQGVVEAGEMLKLLKPVSQAKKAATPLTDAQRRLKEQADKLREDNVDYTLRNRQVSADRAKQKARDEFSKAKAYERGDFNTQEKTNNLKGQQLKFAVDTLKFALGTGLVVKDQVNSVKEHLDVLQKRVREEGKSTQQNQNLANLAHKYNTVAEIRNLKTKEEAELARKVVGYRMRTQQYDEEGLKNQQKLLDAAKSRDHLLTAQAHRQDAARQNERRLNTVTHLEGDGGASMAIVQAGFMMRSQVLGGLSSIFSGAFDSAVQLDKAFRNLQAISASTNYEMATMKVNLINVAQASKFSASEVGETAVMLAQAGLSIQEIGASMKGIITLSQATGTDLAKSVDVVTSVLSIFNKSATETDTIVNQLTAALNESKLDINKMALGLQYAGNIASDSGVSFEELTAALGATANAGIRSGSTLGTGLRQMFIDLQKPNEKLTKRLETLGITLDQVSFRSQGLEGVLRNLRNAGFSSADAFETFEVRSAAAFSALSGNLTDFHDLQEELLDTNAAFEANNVQMESFAVQLDHLKSNLGILAADGLGPVLSLLRDMTKGMAHAMQNAEEGTGVINVLTTAFVSLMTGVTIAWFARLTAGITTTTAALLATRGALSLYWYGIIGVVAAGATFIASIMSQRNESERLNTALDKTKGMYNDLKASLQSKESALANVNDALKNLVDRYGVLKNDSSQTQAVTKSLQEQFNQFGLELEDVADNKIDNVINKVRDLRAELAKDLRQTIIEEAAAKIKLKGEERLKAEADLKETKISGLRFNLNPQGYVSFKEATNPKRGEQTSYLMRPYASDIDKAFGDNPKLRQKFLDLYAGAIRTQSEGKILPTKDFNPDQIMLDLRNKIAEVKDAEAARLLTEAVDNLKKGYDDIVTVIKDPEVRRKINERKDKDVRTIDLQEKFNDPKAIGGASEAKIATLNAEINAIGDIKGLSAKERRKRQSAAAKPVLEWFEKNIASAETHIEALPNEFDRETFKNLMAAVQARMGEVRKILVDNDKQFRKEQLTLLTRQIKAAEADVRFAEEQHKDSSGLITEEKTYVNLENKRKALNKLRFDKAEIESKDADNAEAHIAALRQEVEIEAKGNERERQKKIKAIEDNAKTAANTNLNTADKAHLDAKKKDLDAFYKEIKNREKTLEGRQEAERFQATAKTYRPLTTGNMFDQLNTDEKKAAQAKANATGVSQEYSVFGQAKGAFARQAARFDNESLQKKQVQEKLALETAILFDLQQRKQNLSIEEYNRLKAEQITLEAEVTRLNNIAADARADKHPEDLKLAQEALDRNKEAIQSHQEAEEKLTQDIETRNNTIENLKNNLQALIDKYDLLDTTMSAGVQSMTSGLSSIFSDWASGVIKNTDDVKEAFRSLGQSVLQSMAKVVSARIAQQFMGFLLNGLGSMFGPKTPALADGAIQGLNVNSNLNVDGMSTGGMATPSGVKHFANGGPVGGTYIGRDSVPALLQPNEYVIQRSAVQALGTDFMQNLNNVTAGSLKQGAANLGGSKPMVQNVMKASPPVNVYVVSPEQQRQMGQEDVVVALQDDILRGGTTKKLIKAVITGEI